MRVFAVALLVAGCNFHVEGTSPPSSGVESPGNPGGNDPGSGGTGGTTGGTPTNPGSPPSTGTPTPTPPPAPDMAGTTTPPSPDMAMHGPLPPVQHVGDACAGDADCMEPGLKCFKTLGKGAGAVTLPGGYCSKPCDSRTPCPMGSECVATVYGAFCMNICPSGGCRTGYACCESVNACGLEQFCSGGQGG